MPFAPLQSYEKWGLDPCSLVFLQCVKYTWLIRLALGSITGKCQALFCLSDASTSDIYEISCLVGVTLGYQQKPVDWVLTIFDAQCLIFTFIQVQWKREEFREVKHVSHAHAGGRGFVLSFHFRGGLRILFSKQGMRLGWKYKWLPGNTSSGVGKWDKERYEASGVCLTKTTVGNWR